MTDARPAGLRIAFFGLPLAGLLLHGDGHQIVYAGVCRAGAPGTRRLTRTLGPGRVVITPNLGTERARHAVDAARPDLVVSWFWTTRLPMSVVLGAPLGGFGVHPSLLPRHRGPDPFFWAIDQGDPITGVTAHRIAAEYDTGALLGSRTLRIDPAWDAWTLARRLDRPSLSLLRAVAKAFARGAPPDEVPQDEAAATPAPAPSDALLEIDWAAPSAAIERRIRAAGAFPGAYTFLGDEEVVVTRVRPALTFPQSLRPGEAAVVAGEAVVRTADGALTLLEGRGGAEGEYPLDREALAELVQTLRDTAGPAGGARGGGEGPAIVPRP